VALPALRALPCRAAPLWIPSKRAPSIMSTLSVISKR